MAAFKAAAADVGSTIRTAAAAAKVMAGFECHTQAFHGAALVAVAEVLHRKEQWLLPRCRQGLRPPA